jgi:hypothetical protein
MECRVQDYQRAARLRRGAGQEVAHHCPVLWLPRRALLQRGLPAGALGGAQERLLRGGVRARVQRRRAH